MRAPHLAPGELPKGQHDLGGDLPFGVAGDGEIDRVVLDARATDPRAPEVEGLAIGTGFFNLTGKFCTVSSKPWVSEAGARREIRPMAS